MKRSATQEGGETEKHDSAFLSPLEDFFTLAPYNNTFIDNRYAEIDATSVNSKSDTYEFYHRGHDYGVIKTSEARLSATVALTAVVNDAAMAGDRVTVPSPLILRTMFSSKGVLINNAEVATQGNNEGTISWIRHLLYEKPSGYLPSKEINWAIHDTPGQHDEDDHLVDGAAGLLNVGGFARKTQGIAAPHVIDILDAPCFNENGSDRYLPTNFEIKITLRRAIKQKYLFGTAAHCAAHQIELKKFKMTFPMFKPKEQLSEALNKLLVTNEQEIVYYTYQYRHVARPVAQGVTRITENDIFNGSRPTRLITTLMARDRYNGGYALNAFRLIYPAGLSYYAVRVNEAIIPPIVRDSREAYLQIRTLLNRENSEMPFMFADYESSYGILMTDLSVNKGSFNEVMPNSTSGIVSVEMQLTATAAPAQIIFIGEFRNQIKIGFKTPARKMLDF